MLFRSGTGARHHRLIVGGPGHAHAGEEFAGRRTGGGEFAAGGFGDPVAVAGAGVYRFDVKVFEEIGNGVVDGGHSLILACGRRSLWRGDRAPKDGNCRR